MSRDLRLFLLYYSEVTFQPSTYNVTGAVQPHETLIN